MKHGDIREAFLTAGIEAPAEAFLADCREVLLASDELTDATRPQIIQAMVSLAMQRIMHWAAVHCGEDENPDAIPGQALIGGFTGLGIAIAMFNYDPENVLHECIPALARAWGDAIHMIETRGANVRPPPS